MRIPGRPLYLPFLLLLVTITGSAAERTVTPFLVANINAASTVRPHDVDISRILIDGDDVYYMSWGPRLWRTDGEFSGTFPIGDGNGADGKPGLGGLIGTISGKVIYLGRNGHLWATDGTTPGTVPLMSARMFRASARCGTRLCMSLTDHTVASTDGTPEGTSVIAVTHEPNGLLFPEALASNGAEAFFSGFDERGRCIQNSQVRFCGELWATDGTPAGTRMVKDLVPGPDPSAPDHLFGWNGLVFFKARVAGAIWWRAGSFFVSDGTEAGTRSLLPDYTEDMFEANPRFTAGGEHVYFNTLDGRSWQSDGTPEGTRLLVDVIPLADPATLGPITVTHSPDFLLLSFFRHENGSVQPDSQEIWSYDGQRLTAIHRGGESHVLGYFPPTAKSYYVVYEAVGEPSVLYATDGTAAGTRVAEIGGQLPRWPFLVGNRKAFFPVFSSFGGYELWQTDGTPEGTRRVPNGTVGDPGSGPSDLTSWGNRAYFFAEDTEGTRQLYATRGDAQSTRAIARCDSCDDLEVVEDRLFYRSGSDLHSVDASGLSTMNLGNLVLPPVRLGEVEISLHPASPDAAELWSSDRSTPLARLAGQGPFGALRVGQKLYLVAGRALWVTDGTSDGTFPLRSSGVDLPLAAVADRLLFFSDGRPWASDGSEAGTIALSTSSGDPRPLGSVGGIHLFQFSGALWRTDGTPSGSYTLLEDEWRREFEFSASLDDRVALARRGDASGRIWEILTSDGTHEGTRTAVTLAAPYEAVRVARPVQTGDGKWYLPYYDGRVQLLDLQTLETIVAAGHFQIPGLSPSMGVGDSSSNRFAAVDQRLLFPAAGPLTGIELWGINLDGTRAPLPSVSVSLVGTPTVAGKRTAVFRVTTDVEGAYPPAVRFQTVDGTALAGRDYTPVSGNLSLTETDRIAFIVVPVSDDGKGFFHLMLSAAEHAVIDRGATRVSLDTPQRHRPVRR